MTALSYFDAPAHPLGIVTHPAWDAVRNRWNELHCAYVLNEARERRHRDQKEGGAAAPSSGSEPTKGTHPNG